MEDTFNYNYYLNILKLCGLSDNEINSYMDEYKKLVNVKLFQLVLESGVELNPDIKELSSEEDAVELMNMVRSSDKWNHVNLELNRYMLELMDNAVMTVSKNATDEQKVAVVKYLDEYEARLDEMEKQQANASS